MLDVKWIRAHPDEARRALRLRGADETPLEDLLRADARRLDLLREVENLRAERNATSEEIGRRRREGGDAEDLMKAMRGVADRIRALEADLSEAEAVVTARLQVLPNTPDPDVPVGPDAAGNVEVVRVGTPPALPFEPRAHWEIGTRLGLLDFERAGKISGTRFGVFVGAGARLMRALVDFMLDLHTAGHGYTEVYPPFLVNTASMTATGHLPKFAAEAFRVADADLWLVPTAEVPLTNLHRDEILTTERLPVRYAAFTACFRSEAGAAGRDTRGLIRQHQFDKVELVWLTRPEDSADALETLTQDAAAVLQRLGLAYRVVVLCTGDLGFGAAKTYDIEVWMPSYGRYVEISSCTNLRDFQARRAGIRFRRGPGRVEFVHTLNGSGLAVGRCLAAILENNQQADGSVVVPEALRPYCGGLERVTGGEA